jgi:very-short-patch-repair endonuclease
MRKATVAERKLLAALEIMWEGNPIRWEFQKPIGPFFADFAILDVKVVAEIDGGYHDDPMQMAYDARRTRYLEKIGWTVLRFPNAQVMGDVIGVVKELSATFGLRI